MFDPRPYQVDAIERIRNEIRAGNKRPLLVSPTGSGKTVIASHIINSAIQRRSRILFIAHRKEIIDQTSRKLTALEIDHAIIMSGYDRSAMATVHVASIQTLIRREYPSVDLIIIDESQHVSAKSYQKIIAAYPDAVIIGLTATPCRGDGKGLGGTFNSIVHVAQVRELIDMGYLVPAVVYAPSKPDLQGVNIKRGDYDAAALETAVDKPKLIGDIVQHWYQLAKDRQTIVFATGISHSQHLLEEFRNSGIPAEHLDGETPRVMREAILNRLESGETRVVCNVGVLTEGFDSPGVSCIVLARPTKSFGLFIQMAGRGMRPSPGKENLLILDHAGAVYEHGMIDQDIDWTLDPSRVSVVKKEYEKRELMPWTCGHCFKVNEPSRNKHCTGCGLVPVKAAKSPAIGDGQLKRVVKADRKVSSLIEKEKFWIECLYKAKSLGMKIGAAAHMYRKQTGVWPHHSFKKTPKGVEWRMTTEAFLRLIDNRP